MDRCTMLSCSRWIVSSSLVSTKHDVWHCSNLHWAKVLCRRSRVSRHETSKHFSSMPRVFTNCQFDQGRLAIASSRFMMFYVHLSLCYIYYRYDMYYLIHICALAWLCPAFSQACRMWKLGWEPAVTCSELAGLLAIASWSCEHRHIIQGLAETPTSLPIS